MKTFAKVLGVALVLLGSAMWWMYATFCGVHPHGFC